MDVYGQLLRLACWSVTSSMLATKGDQYSVCPVPLLLPQ